MIAINIILEGQMWARAAAKTRILLLASARDPQLVTNARATYGFTGRADHLLERHSDRHGHNPEQQGPRQVGT
jgi:hypothetical protein